MQPSSMVQKRVYCHKSNERMGKRSCSNHRNHQITPLCAELKSLGKKKNFTLLWYNVKYIICSENEKTNMIRKLIKTARIFSMISHLDLF